MNEKSKQTTSKSLEPKKELIPKKSGKQLKPPNGPNGIITIINKENEDDESDDSITLKLTTPHVLLITKPTPRVQLTSSIYLKHARKILIYICLEANSSLQDGFIFAKYYSYLRRMEARLRRQQISPLTPSTMDALLVEWFIQNRRLLSTNSHKKILKLLHLTKANSNSTCLNCFVKRFNSSLQQIRHMQLSPLIDHYQNVVTNIIKNKNLTSEQIYFVSEFNLDWQSLPRFLRSKLYFLHKDMEYFRIICCSNSTGSHRLPLIFLTQSKTNIFAFNDHMNFPSFKFFNENLYDENVFFNWFLKEFFINEVKNRHANSPVLLVLGNLSFLLKDNKNMIKTWSKNKVLDSGWLTCFYLPKEVSEVLDPLFQGIAESLVRLYRKFILTTLLEDIIKIHEEDHDEEETLFLEVDNSIWNVEGEHSLLTWLNALTALAEAWSQLPPQIIQQAWLQLCPQLDPLQPLREDTEWWLSCWPPASFLIQQLAESSQEAELLQKWLDHGQDLISWTETPTPYKRPIVRNSLPYISDIEALSSLYTLREYFELQRDPSIPDCQLIKKYIKILSWKLNH